MTEADIKKLQLLIDGVHNHLVGVHAAHNNEDYSFLILKAKTVLAGDTIPREITQPNGTALVSERILVAAAYLVLAADKIKDMRVRTHPLALPGAVVIMGSSELVPTSLQNTIFINEVDRTLPPGLEQL